MINFNDIPKSDTKTRICIPMMYSRVVAYAMESNNIDYARGSLNEDKSPETQAFLKHWAQKCKDAFNAKRCHPDCLVVYETDFEPEALFSRILHGIENDADMKTYMSEHKSVVITNSDDILDL